ncbi:hypothetical protein IAT38_001278 [Cryptococcus sp. DSM 104549]
MSEAHVPKAILYSWPTSVWSTVPRLCLIEKGYSDDEYDVRFVNIELQSYLLEVSLHSPSVAPSFAPIY